MKDSSNAGDAVLLTGERVFDGERLLPKGIDGVLVQKGLVTAVGRQNDLHPQARQSIPLPGCTLLPGLIDAHVHFFGVDTLHVDRLFTEAEAYRALRAARDARAMLDAGYTAVRCLGSTIGPHVSRAIREGVIDGPQVVPAGQFVAPSAGTWDDLSVPFDLVAKTDMFADGVDATQAIVRRRVRQGAEVIKIGTSVGSITDHFRAWGDLPDRQITPYTSAEIESVTREAHRFGLKVSSHSIGDAAVRAAVLGGVDVIEHGHGVTEETRAMMAERGTVLVPTLTHSVLMKLNGPAAGLPREVTDVASRHLDQQIEDFQRSISAGITIAAGSDLIGPPWAPFGENATEVLSMVEYGLSNERALQAATSVGASVLGIGDEKGAVRGGMIADVIAVEGNPLDDVGALKRVVFVMQGGVVKVLRLEGSLKASATREV